MRSERWNKNLLRKVYKNKHMDWGCVGTIDGFDEKHEPIIVSRCSHCGYLTTEIRSTCPECGYIWEVDLDIRGRR